MHDSSFCDGVCSRSTEFEVFCDVGRVELVTEFQEIDLARREGCDVGGK